MCIAKDNHLSIDALLENDYRNLLNIENVAGSFMYGLDELKKVVCVVGERNILALRPIDVKIFYLISLLLIGVSKFQEIIDHIDFPT